MLFTIMSVYAHPPLYLDPGSGSLLVQILLAALLGAGVTVRLFWKRIAAFFGRDKSSVTSSIEEEDDE